MWRSALAALLLSGMLIGGAHAGTATGDEETSLPECCRPKVARAPEAGVIFFRADGCEASKTLAPVIAGACDSMTSKPVLFVTMDFTTPARKEQAEFLAKALGLDTVWSGFSKATGYAIVVDWPSKKPVGKVTRFDSAELLLEQVNSVLNRPTVASR